MKNYERTYATVQLHRNSSVSPRVPDYILHRVVLSEKIHQYVADRIHQEKPVVLDLAAFHTPDRDGDDSVTVVLSIPYQMAGSKTRMQEILSRLPTKPWDSSK